MPVAGAIIGAVGSIGGAMLASDAASDSADAQANAVGQSSAANIALAREQRARNEALFAQYLGDENQARAYMDALYYGTGSFTPGAGVPTGGAGSYSAPTPITYPLYDTNGNLLSTDPLRQEQIAYYAANNIQVVDSSGRPVGGPAGAAANAPATPGQATTITREQVLAMIEGTPLAQLANQDFAAREGLAGETYAGARDLADEEYDALRGVGDENYNDSYALAGEARAGRRGVAQENLDSRIGLEEDSYAAWLPISQQAEEDAINLNFSRGGVTGLVGATRRGVGETTQSAGMERNLRRLTGLQEAYAPYYDDVTGAEESYWGDVGDADLRRGDVRVNATALRGDRNQRGYDTYSRTRSANYDTFAGDRLNSYADYTGFLQGRADRGYGARANIASGGQAFVDAATRENSRAGDAAANSYARQGQIQQTLYGDLADIAGGAAGAIFNRKK